MLNYGGWVNVGILFSLILRNEIFRRHWTIYLQVLESNILNQIYQKTIFQHCGTEQVLAI